MVCCSIPPYHTSSGKGARVWHSMTLVRMSMIICFCTSAKPTSWAGWQSLVLSWCVVPC